MEEIKKNYIDEYYKNRNSNIAFFNKEGIEDYENSARIASLEEEISKLRVLIDEKELSLIPLYSKRYNDNYVHTAVPQIAHYNTRDNVTKYYSIPNGTLVNSINFPKNYHDYPLDIKSGEIMVLDGYSYEHGGVIVKKYLYKIKADNNSCNFTFVNEFFVPVFDDDGEGQSMSGFSLSKYSSNGILNNIQGDEFINTMFGISRTWGGKNLGYFRDRFVRNKSFEIIARTAPDDILYKLLDMNCDVAKPIHKILGLDKGTYEKAQEKGMVSIICALRKFIEDKELFFTNMEDWLDIISIMKKYEEDLQFFGIRIFTDYDYTEKREYENCLLLGLLCSWYQKYSCFNRNYSFGKFYKYVVDETINQGYNCVKNFLVELRDYLTMCEEQKISPTLYSSYLKQTHDICSRNHKIFIEAHQEEIFKERYKDYKEVKCDNEYCVIAPKDSKDLQKEGDTLNHCVHSYLKRILDGATLIFFLRKTKEKDTPVVTMEVRDGAVVQCRGLHNRKTTREEDDAIKSFANKQKLKISY